MVRFPSFGAALIALALAGCHGGAITVDPGPDQREVGFGVPVTLAARTAGLPRGARFRWEQIGGPDVGETMRGADTPRLSFVTRRLEDLVTLENRPYVVAFSPRTAGEYRFRLTVEARGRSGRGEVLVTSAARQGGVSGIPVGLGVWLAVPAAGSYAWRVMKAPPRSHARPQPAAGRATRLVPDVAGQYVVEEQTSKVQFNLYAGRWADVPKDCGRSACHGSQAKGWQKTRHATVMARGLAGALKGRGVYRTACLRCHATGYDDTVDNGGFDDEARRVGWTLPTSPSARPKPLPAPLRPLENVTCLSCHGPGKLNYSSLAVGRSVHWGVGPCAVCHDAPPAYPHVVEWRRSKMAARVDRAPGPATTPGCAACHSAQGFIGAVRGDPTRKPGLLRAEPVTCPACHDPHAAANPRQLRLSRAELCVRCHRAAVLPPEAGGPDDRAPHAPQADLVAGRGAQPVGGGVPPAGGPHATIADGCVRCHMARGGPGPLRVGGHTFLARDGAIENTAACGGHCHPGRTRFDLRAREDFDGDGVVETNQQEVEGLLAAVAAELGQRLAQRHLRGCGGEAAGVGATAGRIVLVDARGVDLGDCDHDGTVAGAERPFVLPHVAADLYACAYDYLLVKRDGSRGLHNLPFAVDLLKRTLAALRAMAPAARRP